MDERLESLPRASKSSLLHPRKGKKRSARKSYANPENWRDNDSNCGETSMPAMDYRQMVWQQPAALPPHMQPQNAGQRLFAAVSDPSVCGYSPLPMAYTMEPVMPMYPLYRPIARPNNRASRGGARRNVVQNNSASSQPPAILTNGYSSLQENRSNYYCPRPEAYQNGDYASLPPTANKVVTENCEELTSEHRRYSDPGLGPGDLVGSSNSEDSDSCQSGSSITTIGKNNKLIMSLVEQMTALRQNNSQMFKELHEAKTDMECMKSELLRLKQTGSSDYQPGMLSDIVRKMREANEALDEAMITKVNAMVDEQNRQRTMEFEKLRIHLEKITEEKEKSHKRIAKLEEEVAALKLNVNNEDREIAALEEESLALRRQLQEERSSRNLAENHAAKLEKLVDILRKKMNGASSEETVAEIRELVSCGLNHPVAGAAKISPGKIEEILRATSLRDSDHRHHRQHQREVDRKIENDEGPDEEAKALSPCDLEAGSFAKNCERRASSTDSSACSNSNNSLIGPVTDL